jgi:hypothetical protein
METRFFDLLLNYFLLFYLLSFVLLQSLIDLDLGYFRTKDVRV